MRPRATSRPSGRVIVLTFAVAVALAMALIAAAVLLRGGDSTPAPSTTPAVDLSGIAQDGIVLGAADAPVTLIEYADLQCPFCREYAEGVLPAVVDEYVRSGRVKLEFRGLAFLGPDSEKALRLVLAAGLQDRLWQLQEALFRNQGGENSGWVTDELVRGLAAEIPGLDVGQLFDDADSSAVTALIEAAAEQANEAQVGGTPWFVVQIGDRAPYLIQVPLEPASFRSALDDALEG